VFGHADMEKHYVIDIAVAQKQRQPDERAPKLLPSIQIADVYIFNFFIVLKNKKIYKIERLLRRDKEDIVFNKIIPN
jgi:hypothetical protein